MVELKTTGHDDDKCDENNVPGCGRVTDLAHALIHFSEQIETGSLGNEEVDAVGNLRH